jgi:hypothetical protein
MEILQLIGAPSDVGFRELRLQLRGETEIRAVRIWLREQKTSRYREDMHAIFSRWCKAVGLNGHYVEK